MDSLTFWVRSLACAPCIGLIRISAVLEPYTRSKKTHEHQQSHLASFNMCTRYFLTAHQCTRHKTHANTLTHRSNPGNPRHSHSHSHEPQSQRKLPPTSPSSAEYPLPPPSSPSWHHLWAATSARRARRLRHLDPGGGARHMKIRQETQ